MHRDYTDIYVIRETDSIFENLALGNTMGC